MLHKHSRSLVLLLGLCAACGGDDDVDDTDGDGGARDGGVLADASQTDSGLDSGTDASASTQDVLESGLYSVSNPVKISDGCGLTLEDGTFTQLRLENINRTTIALGSPYSATTEPAWTPAGYALGSGPWLTSRTTTLMAASRVKITQGSTTCEFSVQRTTSLVYTGPNTVTIDYTDNESAPTAGCASLGGPSGSCTSRYTFTLSNPQPLPSP